MGMTSKTQFKFVGSVVGVLALTVTVVSPAYAESSGEEGAEDVVATVQAAAPETDLAVPGSVDDGQLVTTVEGTSAEVPLWPRESIVVTSSTEEGEQVASIDLPDEIDLGTGTIASDGSVVYASEDGSGDAAVVQTLADGSTRIQTVIASADSPHEFGYGMDGYQPYQADTGEVIFIDDEGNAIPVAAPWATDAAGAAVPTHYEIRGGELFQVVTPDASTAYPIVADPTWMWNGPAWGMKLTRAESSRVRDYAAALGMCVLFAKSVAVKACGAFGSYIVLQANLAQGDSPKSCLFFTAAPIPGVIWRIKC